MGLNALETGTAGEGTHSDDGEILERSAHEVPFKNAA